MRGSLRAKNQNRGRARLAFCACGSQFDQASRLNGITSPRLRDLAAATIEAKRSVA